MSIFESLATVALKKTECLIEWINLKAWTQEWDEVQQTTTHSYGYSEKSLKSTSKFSAQNDFHGENDKWC